MISKNYADVSSLAPCTHEEADTRIFLHVKDAVQHNHSKITIRTVDTDVVLAISAAQSLDVSELWVAFGVGKNFRFIAAHHIARALGPEKCIALPMFHAFTGCDTVSFFGGRGKKTAWDTWKAYHDATIDIRHRTGLETDHVRHVASPAICVCDNEMRSRLLPRFYFELFSLLE